MKIKTSTLSALALLTAASSTFSADIDWNGKFRYRYERTHYQGTPGQDGTVGRSRERISGKLGAKSIINDHLVVRMGLATGGTSATSTNQTLGSSNTNDTRSIGLDYAQFDFKCPLTGLKIGGGKVQNPFYRPGKTLIIWDGDVRQEGLHAGHSKKFGAFGYDVLLANMWVKEHDSSTARRDDKLLAAQLAFTFDTDLMNFRLGYSRYNYENLQGRSDIAVKGNTAVNSLHKNNYRLQETYLVVGTKIMDMPMEAFIDLVSNQAAPKNNKASTYGVNFGKAKKKGSYKISYNFRKIEKDAVVAGMADADPLAGQGSDWKGHTIGASYAVLDNTFVGITHQMAEDNIKPEAGASTKSYDWKLTQLNFVVKF